jgi:hypothetical protein
VCREIQVYWELTFKDHVVGEDKGRQWTLRGILKHLEEHHGAPPENIHKQMTNTVVRLSNILQTSSLVMYDPVTNLRFVNPKGVALQALISKSYVSLISAKPQSAR